MQAAAVEHEEAERCARQSNGASATVDVISSSRCDVERELQQMRIGETKINT